MMLRIGNRTFDWVTLGIPNIEPRSGAVALAARHSGDDDLEILDAVATDDMRASAERLVEQGRFREDRPGVVVGLIVTPEADRTEAKHIAETLMRHRRVRGEWTDGSPTREPVPWKDLADMASESARRALGLR